MSAYSSESIIMRGEGHYQDILHLHHFLFSRETCIDRAYIDDKEYGSWANQE